MRKNQAMETAHPHTVISFSFVHVVTRIFVDDFWSLVVFFHIGYYHFGNAGVIPCEETFFPVTAEAEGIFHVIDSSVFVVNDGGKLPRTEAKATWLLV